MADIAVLGSGGWGCAMSIMLSKCGHKVSLWSKFEQEIEELSVSREHKKLLSGVKIPDSVDFCTDLECIKGKDIIVFAVPSFALRETARAVKGLIEEDQVIVNIGKGLEEITHKRLSQVIDEELSHKKLCILSGPSHAEEVSRGFPTTNVASSEDIELARYVQDVFMNPAFRVYTNSDVIGAEIGGSVKNVIALCAGVCDGLGYGDNTKAALLTRGIAEMARLGVKMGAQYDTFMGLTGIGDLIVTCTSMHSRNRRAGILIGQGKNVKDSLSEVNMVVEGYTTAKAAYNLSKELNVEMPIITQAYCVLYENKSPKDAIKDLMSREKKDESEREWLGGMESMK